MILGKERNYISYENNDIPHNDIWLRIMDMCQRRIEAFEMFAHRRMLGIPWTDHRTNIYL